MAKCGGLAPQVRVKRDADTNESYRVNIKFLKCSLRLFRGLPDGLRYRSTVSKIITHGVHSLEVIGKVLLQISNRSAFKHLDVPSAIVPEFSHMGCSVVLDITIIIKNQK